MKKLRLARLAGLVCLAGGVIQVIYGLFAIPFGPYASNTNFVWDEALWALANVGMIGAILGLLLLDVARPRWLAVSGGLLAILGHLIRIGASLLLVRQPTWDPTAPILVSILLMLLGMAALGVAILLGKQLIGWWAWMPLLVPLFGFMTAAVYSINLYIHFILLGLWGIPWLLVGYVVLTHAAQREKLGQNAASRTGTNPLPGLR